MNNAYIEKRPVSIAIVNQKGGCGKTTTAINLASCLALSGYQTLLIDTDPQAQATLGLGVELHEECLTLYDALTKGVPLEKIVRLSSVMRLDLIGANSLLAGAQLDIASSLGREAILRSAFDKLALCGKYDYVIMDCPPTLNLVTVNVLAASQYVLIPFQTHYFALQGIKELFHTIDTVRERLNPQLDILGILVTLFDQRNKVNHEILRQMNEYFKEKMFRAKIRNNVKLCEAPMHQKPIHLYAAQSKGAADYWELTREVIERTQRRKDHHVIEPVVHYGSSE